MRFFIDVRRAAPDAWEVVVTSEADLRLRAARSMRRLVGSNGEAVPLPPSDYVADLPTGAAHYALCTATDPRVVLDTLNRLASRQADTRAAEAFGQYLFACLFGEEVWSQIAGAVPSDAPLELSLSWGLDEAALYGLPWELIRGPTRFLCADPDREISMTHRVPRRGPAGGPAGEVALTVKPRVLFVIGAALSDPAIQAGAEYLGLIRRIRAAGSALITRVLIEARPQQVRDAVAVFAPSIAHFVCHGAIEGGRGRIYLMADEDNDAEAPLDAEQIVGLLGGAATRPPVVVLNACQTGGGVSAPLLSAPLAAELVAAGIPIVVGHTGAITDRACRLFTRRFYEALLSGENLGGATAEGRRAGHVLGAAARGIDWAMPAVFMAEGVSPAVGLQDADAVQVTEQRAAYYATLTNPATFCGRIECSEAFNAMLYDRGIAPVRVLAYEVVERDRDAASRYGKTRLLQELAAHAIRDGVVPCLVSFSGADTKPKNALALGMSLVRAIRETRQRFGLSVPAVNDFEVGKLRRRIEEGDTTVGLHVSVQDELDLQVGKPQANGHVVGAAIRRDLWALANDLAPQHRERGPVSRIAVLLDEVHEYGDAARELLEQILTADGLGTPGNPIPVVLAYSGSMVAGDASTAAHAITTFFEKGRAYAFRVPLGAFRSPVEDRLAYRQFLLALNTPRKPMVIGEEEQNAEVFLKLLHERVRGVPSRLELSQSNDGVFATVDAFAAVGILKHADDDDALVEIRRPKERRS